MRKKLSLEEFLERQHRYEILDFLKDGNKKLSEIAEKVQLDNRSTYETLRSLKDRDLLDMGRVSEREKYSVIMNSTTYVNINQNGLTALGARKFPLKMVNSYESS